MQTAEAQGASDAALATFGAALQRFGQLLQAIWSESAAATPGRIDPQPLGPRLAAEFDRWLRDPAAMPPWWQNLQMAPGFAPPPVQPGQPFDLPFLHVAPVAGPGRELLRTCRRRTDLMMRWAQLQAQLATHWSAFARSAAEKFMTSAASPPPVPDWTNIRRLYDSWIDCAEQAYAATVHTDDFCRTQAELVNIVTELLLAQREQVESVARMFGMPTRSEVDALRDRIRQMQKEAHPPSPRRAGKAQRRKGKTG